MENEIQMAPAVISAIKIREHKIELMTNLKDQPVARYFKMMSSGKNKGQYKLFEGYYFGTEEKRKIWVEKKIADISARYMEEQKSIAVKKEIRANMKHGFEVGQVYENSWGVRSD